MNDLQVESSRLSFEIDELKRDRQELINCYEQLDEILGKKNSYGR